MMGKGFWAGFGLVSFIFIWNMISWFYPTVPTFPTATPFWFQLPRGYPPFWVFISTFVISFSYFASLEVLFSIWVFDVLFTFEAGVLNRLGLGATGYYTPIGSFKWQTAGSFMAVSLRWVWVARHHIRDVVRKAFWPDRIAMDDGHELLSYRRSVLGLAVSCLFIALWLWHAGMEPKAILVVIPLMFVIYIGVAKVVADSGLIYVNSPTTGAEFAAGALGGPGLLKPSTNAIFGASMFALSHYKGSVISPLAHINRLGDFIIREKSRLLWAVCGAFAVGLTVSALYTVWLGYGTGAYNFQPNWLIIHGGRVYYERIVVPAIREPEPLKSADYWFFFSGVGIMLFLNLMRYRFTWWPFHPVGFALSGMTLTRRTSVTIFLAWLVKFLMIKLAGPAFYRRSKPFFIGLLVAFVLMVFVGIVVDGIWFPTHGHEVNLWY